MDHQRKLIVGYDLCNDFSQISCYSYKTFEPIPICTKGGEDSSLIPTVLCINKETKLWSYGNEAVDCASSGNGVLVDKLLTKLITGEEFEVYDERLSPVTLLEKFLRKTLTLIKNYFPTEPITKLVVTVKDMEPKIVEGIYEALYLLGIEKDRAMIMSHPGAYMYYALSQDKSLWVNDVGLFDFSESGLCYYQISINRRTSPMIAGMEKNEYTDTLNYSMLSQKGLNLGYIFENIANTVLYKQIISTLYFTGTGFEGDWHDQVIKSLCMGRRVFLGQNLYTKGACYAAKELSGDQKLGDVILLNNEMLKNSLWIRVYTDAALKEVMLTDAAVPWYEVDSSIDIIPDEEDEIEVISRNIMTREIKRERLKILNLPNRPTRMTRLSINLTCTSRTQAKILITDLGFGEIYPETGRVWEFLIEI